MGAESFGPHCQVRSLSRLAKAGCVSLRRWRILSHPKVAGLHSTFSSVGCL